MRSRAIKIKHEGRIVIVHKKNVYGVKIGGSVDTDQIVANLDLPADSNITQKNFPLKLGDTKSIWIEVVDPGNSRFTEEQGLAILADNKLKRPTRDGTIRFIQQHSRCKAFPKKRFILFLHPPRRYSDRSSPSVLCLDRRTGCRYVFLMSVTVRFDGNDCVLAGVQFNS